MWVFVLVQGEIKLLDENGELLGVFFPNGCLSEVFPCFARVLTHGSPFSLPHGPSARVAPTLLNRTRRSAKAMAWILCRSGLWKRNAAATDGEWNTCLFSAFQFFDR